MSATETLPIRCTPEPLAEGFVSVQPGGGVCYRIELAWGCWRRWWLKRFRGAYVRHMAERRLGGCEGVGHAILDPRDLKYCRNRCRCHWDAADDPFRWRQRLPFARWGLAELQLMGWPLLALTVILAFLPPLWCYLASLPAVLLGLIVYFFRDPPRRVPQEPGQMVSPADGKIVEITHLDHHEFVDGKAVRIGIFLSIFNVHVNRAPARCRVIAARYSPGGFCSALNPQSSVTNENTWIALEEESPPHRKLVVRQISGAVARRIVCNLRPGEVVGRGHKFGMIKLGSRTELILPETDDLQMEVALGQRVKAGSSVLARYPVA